MVEVLRACALALRSLGRPAVLWQGLWPPLVALALWSAIAAVLWKPAHGALVDLLPDVPWQGTVGWLTDFVAHIALLLALAPFVYFTAILLVAAFALPRMMTIVAAADYADVEQRGTGAFWGSVGNTLAAGVIFVIGWLATLPLLFVPGGLFVIPLAWTAWLNQRTFRFDALAVHATPGERRAIVAGYRGRLYLAGLPTALAAHVPLANLLAPAFTALVYVHLCLAALRRQRQESVQP